MPTADTHSMLVTYNYLLDVRTEWEHTIENMSVLEEISEDTLIFLQVRLKGQRGGAPSIYKWKISDVHLDGMKCKRKTKPVVNCYGPASHAVLCVLCIV